MPHPGVEGGYALAFINSQRHVATALAAAGVTGRSLDDMHRTYHHNPAGDLHRVRLHEHQPSDRAAERWLLERAILEMGTQVACEDSVYRLTVPVEQLLDYKGDQLHVIPPDANAQFDAPFNPHTTTGDFARNMRARGRDDTSELETSMRAFGWLPEFPAIADENGVILVGHRRIAVAQRLGIEPIIMRPGQPRGPLPAYGEGDLGTVNRAIVGFASNIGIEPFNVNDRRLVASRMHVTGHSITEIAEFLQTSKSQISRDLRAASVRISHMGNTNSERHGRRGRPDSAGLILDYVATRPDGATADEITVALDGTHQNISARIHYLVESGELLTTGERRPTRTGRPANVVTLAPHVQRQPSQPAAVSANPPHLTPLPTEPYTITVAETPVPEPEPQLIVLPNPEPVAAEPVTVTIVEVCSHCCPIHCPQE
jgi:hypothetical protein